MNRPPARLALAAIVAIAALGASLTGCTSKEDKPMLTHQQAVDETERLIKEATGNLKPAPRLEVFDLGNAPCSGPNDDQNTKTHIVEHRYWLRDVTGHEDEVYESMLAYMRAGGYKNIQDNWKTTDHRLIAEHSTNSFSVSLRSNDRKDLLITVDSTCVPN
ncbi:hypothetical protein R8Z50_30210 [Longispora sp. K20-0274]|uniref:hypothetical protein n=1 Tax=Longispora sp. K20-0274 TaxID=3088255 RepID=UPI00399A091D